MPPSTPLPERSTYTWGVARRAASECSPSPPPPMCARMNRTWGCRVAKATRHPQVRFILAHIGGGGDGEHSLAALRATPHVYVDLSGSGVDGGMLEACLEAAGVERLLWGTDLTMDTGWAKLRYLERLLPPGDLELVQWRNAARIFPRGAFPAD